jgi:hypothetical protein
MASDQPILLSLKEVAALIVKDRDLHEGHWGLLVKFGIGATNVKSPETDETAPAAIVPIVSLGIRRFDSPSSMTVDAAKVNPSPRGRTRKVEKPAVKARPAK